MGSRDERKKIRNVKIGIVVGEHSGDLLGAELIEALKQAAPDLEIEGVPGPKMESLGCKPLFSMERLNVMGFIDPLLRLPELWWRRRRLIQHWSKNRPDVVITIDAPDFNLGLARHLKKIGLKVIHYVSPTVWAWRPNRIYTVAKAVDHLLTLFPFEPACYQAVPNLKVSYVGHPLADRCEPIEKAVACRALGLHENKLRLALLPGSRTREIKTHLPIFLETAYLLQQEFPELEICIAAVDEKKAKQIASLTQYPIMMGKTREVIAASDVVLVVSGTATLETLLLGRPMVVAYKTGKWTYWFAKRLIKTPFIALPNILKGEALVPEYIQAQCVPLLLSIVLKKMLTEDSSVLKQKFAALRDTLKRNAAQRACETVFKEMAQ